MSAGGIILSDTQAGDLIFVLRSDGTNPHAVKQFARVLKHALRIQGLTCVDARQVQLQPLRPAAAPQNS